MATSGYGRRTTCHGCSIMFWSNNSQNPHGPRAVPIRASYGPRTWISNVLRTLRGPHGARAGPARVPYGALTGTLRNWHNHNLQKSRTGVVCGRTGPVRASHGLFTGCLSSLNPYGARKLIMHALKLYGPRTGGQNSYGAARDPWVDVRFLFKTAREQPVRGPGVWCDWGITRDYFEFYINK